MSAALKTDFQIVSKIVSSENFLRTMFISTLSPHLLLPCRHATYFLSNHAGDDFDRLTASCGRICKSISKLVEEDTSLISNSKSVLKSLIHNNESLQLKVTSPLSIRGYQTLQRAGWLNYVNSSIVSSLSLARNLASIPAPSTPQKSAAANNLLRLLLTMNWPRALEAETRMGSFLDCLLDSRDYDTTNDDDDDDDDKSSKITCLGSRFYHYFRESFVEILTDTPETFRVALERATSAIFSVSAVNHISDVVFTLLRHASRRQDLISFAESSLQRLCLQWLPNGHNPEQSKWSDLTCLLRDMIVVPKSRVSLLSSSSVVINAVVSLLRSEAVSVEIKMDLLGVFERLLTETKTSDVLMGALRVVVSQYFPIKSSALDSNSEDARNYERILRSVRLLLAVYVITSLRINTS